MIEQKIYSGLTEVLIILFSISLLINVQFRVDIKQKNIVFLLGKSSFRTYLIRTKIYVLNEF